VVIGLDEALPSMQNFVLIGAAGAGGGEVMGSLAGDWRPGLTITHDVGGVLYPRLFDKL